MRLSSKTKIENCTLLSVGHMLRTQMLVPGKSRDGSIHWTRSGSMQYQRLLQDEGRGVLRLMWVAARDGQRQTFDRMVFLLATPQPFGGLRWWFVCPITGRRVSKLYKPGWADKFASRGAYHLDYACQRETDRDRALRKAHRLREQLGNEGGIGDYISKPKWMHWKTFDRREAEVRAADARALSGMMMRLAH